LETVILRYPTWIEPPRDSAYAGRLVVEIIP
jgi:hypothetical protein